MTKLDQIRLHLEQKGAELAIFQILLPLII